MHELGHMFTKTQRVEKCLNSKNEHCLAIERVLETAGDASASLSSFGVTYGEENVLPLKS